MKGLVAGGSKNEAEVGTAKLPMEKKRGMMQRSACSRYVHLDDAAGR